MALVLNRLPLAGKVGVGGVVLVLLSVSYYVFWHSDVSTKITREKVKTGELDAELAKQRQAQQSYFADRDELAMRQQKQRDLNKVLPTETEAATFLSAIQSVSNLSGIDLKAWNPLEEVPQTFFAKVPMKLKLTGRFHQIAKFIYEVGRQDRIINMENLELLEPKLEGDDVVLTASCLATTFHLIKKASPPPGAPPGAPAPGASAAPAAPSAPAAPAAPKGKP